MKNIKKYIPFLLILISLIINLIISGCSTKYPHKNIYSQKKINYIINKKSKKYKINKKLIKAIIKTESNFKHKAVSRTGAIGLMQIKPKIAGADVNQKILKKRGFPTRRELFIPQINIEYGVAYIYILKNYYLKGIKNKKKKELCIIASYNGGAGALLRMFDKNRKKAIKKINKISFYKLYETILLKHKSKETRRYITKVLSNKEKY